MERKGSGMGGKASNPSNLIMKLNWASDPNEPDSYETQRLL